MPRHSSWRRSRPSSSVSRSACNASEIVATRWKSGARQASRSRSASPRSRTTRSWPFSDRREPIMTLDDLLGLLFPSGHTVERGPSGTVHGTAKVEGQGEVTVIGIAEGTPLGVDGATILAGHIL